MDKYFNVKNVLNKNSLSAFGVESIINAFLKLLYRMFFNNMQIFKGVILVPILRRQLHMNVFVKRFNF